MRFFPVEKNQSGTILLATLWVLVILTILALSVGRSTGIEITLARHAMAKAKSKYIAWAGIVYALDQIKEDSEDKSSGKRDTLYSCAIPMDEGYSPVDIFKEHALGEGYFEVYSRRQGLPARGAQAGAGGEGGGGVDYGLQDEERRININALTFSNASVLTSLLVLLEVDPQTAQTIAFSVLDWKDADNLTSKEGSGAEDDYYTGLARPYHCKNLPFDSKEELLLVRGMDKETYRKIEDYITVFPKGGNLKINFDTASGSVVLALAYAFAGSLTNTDTADADALTTKMLDYRRGEDGMEFTADDRPIEMGKMALNAKENVLFLAMNQFRTEKSDYIYVHSEGTERSRGAKTEMDAVVYRQDLSIRYWHRE
jgi:type II secretory pathway component PulK